MTRRLAALAIVAILSACSANGSGTPPLRSTPTPAPPQVPPWAGNVQRISSDPFTNGSSQHATEVEPSAAAFGATVVTAFQTGRFFAAGASDIGVATSLDGGATWIRGVLGGTTTYALPSGPYDGITDPAVAYDARHATWLISALPVLSSNAPVPAAVVARSSDGVTWSSPAAITPADETMNDKDWIACDDHGASDFFGNCYVEWDNYAGQGEILMSTSTDGGRTWSRPATPSRTVGGIGGQPLVQPGGTVIVPIDDINAQKVLAFRSADGGQTWSEPIAVSAIADHAQAANLRSLPLVTAAADAAGTVYVVWQDCRFRAGCAADDLVLSTSADGRSWSAPARIPIDAVTSQVDHFIPGLGIDPATAGSGAHLGVTYYSYANTACAPSTCLLSADFIASTDGGISWGAPQLLAGPMNVQWLAQTLDGAMVGDYMATAFDGSRPVSFAAIANPFSGGRFDEGLYASKPGVITEQSALRRTSIGERPVPGFHSDHPPRRIHP